MRDLAALPKAHLHLHLEAGMRPSTLADLAAKYDIAMPEIRGFGSFAAFSDMYAGAIAVLRERDDWERVADEIIADHVADGAVYLEPAFGAIQYRDRFSSDRECWEFVIDIFDAAAARHGIAVGWMVPVDRVMESPEQAIDVARLGVALRPYGAVSFGLHNDEVGHPPGDFVDAFRSPATAGCSAHPTQANSNTVSSSLIRSISSAPTASSTACVPSRSLGSSNGWPRSGSVSTCAPRRTSCCRCFQVSTRMHSRRFSMLECLAQ